MPRLVVSPLVLPDEHPPNPRPSPWPALITLPTLAKFHIVWRRLCDVAGFPSRLFEHTLTAVCILPGYQSGRKYKIQSYILRPSKCPFYVRPDLYCFEVRLASTLPPSLQLVVYFGSEWWYYLVFIFYMSYADELPHSISLVTCIC